MSQPRKDVLNGWKEIAAYLGRDPRTVERWEKQRSLPVRRLPGSGRATVYALTTELDRWLVSSPAREAEAQAPVEEETVGAVAAGGTASALFDGDRDPVEVGAENGRAKGGGAKWLRWAGLVGCLLLVGWAGLQAAGWKRRHGVAASGEAEPRRPRTLVPSSPVFGVEEIYLRGCYQEEMRTPDSLRRAEGSFRAAIAKDARYAPAYAGLASTFLLLREYSKMPDEEAYPRAKEAASEAVALDPEWPPAHAALGFVEFFWNWNSRGAEEQFQTALHLDPGSALAHHWYGSVLTHEGRFREGLEELNIAQRLEPTSGAILTTRAFAMGLGGRKQEAVELMEGAIGSKQAGVSRDPATMHGVLGLLNLLPPRDALQYATETANAAELRGDVEEAATMRVAAATDRTQGEKAMWRALLTEEQKRHRSGGPTYAMARYEAELGAKDQAMDDLADLFSRHDTALIGIAVDPLLDGLRAEARFRQLRAGVGIPETDRP